MRLEELFEGKYEDDSLKRMLKQIPDTWKNSKFFADGDWRKQLGWGKNPYVVMSFTKIFNDLNVHPKGTIKTKYFLYDYSTFVKDLPAVEKLTTKSLDDYASQAKSTYDALVKLSAEVKACTKRVKKYLDKLEKYGTYKAVQAAYAELKLPSVTISPGPNCLKSFTPVTLKFEVDPWVDALLSAVDDQRSYFVGNVWDLLEAAGNWFSLLDDIKIEITYPPMVPTAKLSGIGIKSIEGIPELINTDLDLSGNRIHDLHNLPKVIKGQLDLSYNELESLHGISKVKEMDGELHVVGNNIRSHILGVVMIKGCTGVTGFINKKVREIISKYLPNTRGNDAVMECQNELIDAGFEEYAQL